MRWPWQWFVRQAKDGDAAEAAREESVKRLEQAKAQRPAVEKAAQDLAWAIEQSMRRQR